MNRRVQIFLKLKAQETGGFVRKNWGELLTGPLFIWWVIGPVVLDNALGTRHWLTQVHLWAFVAPVCVCIVATGIFVAVRATYWWLISNWRRAGEIEQNERREQ